MSVDRRTATTAPSASPAHPGRRAYVWLAAGIATGAVVTAAVVGVALAVVFGERIEAGAPAFVDETATSGIRHSYDGGYAYFVGGGAAVFDCDGTGTPDVYLAGGESPAGLYRNVSSPGGALRFAPVTAPAAELGQVTGAYPIEIDDDGFVDLVVLRVGENVVLRGRGDCRFERAPASWNIDGGDEWTAAFSATWEAGAVLPTLAFGNYVALSEDGTRSSGSCSDSVLIRPSGQTYGDPVPLTPGLCTLSVLFSDADRSGVPELRMTNDRHYYRDGEEQLWRIDAGEPPRLYTRDEGWQRLQIWGMGIASQDLTGDGLPEVFLTSQGDNKLQTPDVDTGWPAYVDVALASGATAHRPFAGDDVLPSTAWHAEFDDVNNDGFMDLFVAKGNVDSMTEYATDDPNNLLMGTADGTFVEGAAEAGVLSFAIARGGALADFNLDGLLDLLVVNRRENVSVWRNTGTNTDGHWLAVLPRQPAPNSHAVGSWIEVETDGRTIVRELTIGGGHAGGELGPIHFGLGRSDEARVRVVWPDGEVGPWLETEVDRAVTILRGASEIAPWSP